MIGPQPRTSHRNRKTKEEGGGLKKQPKKTSRLKRHGEWAFNAQDVERLVVWGISGEEEKGVKKGKMTCHANDRADHTAGRSFVYVI